QGVVRHRASAVKVCTTTDWSPEAERVRVRSSPCHRRTSSKCEEMTNSIQPVVLRNGFDIVDPVSVVLGFLERWHFEVSPASEFASFAEPDLRRANRGGARISAAEIEAILGRSRAIKRALGTIAAEASFAGGGTSGAG